MPASLSTMLSSALGFAALAIALPVFGAAGLLLGTVVTVKVAIFALGVLFKLVLFGTAIATAIAIAWGVARMVRSAR